MPVCIIPAAGSSRRMGRPKALLPWRGSTVVETLTRTLLEGGVRHIWLVRRPEDSELQQFCAVRPRLTAVANPRPTEGMLSSVLAGVEAWLGHEGPDLSPLLICPVDHPQLEPATVTRLLGSHAESPRHMIVPTHEGRRGHPLLIPPSLIGELQDLDPTRSLKQLLERHPEAVFELEVADAGVVGNLNTPEDYARALGRRLSER